jgi:hypothetical protein
MPLQSLDAPSYVKRTRVFPVFRESLKDNENWVPDNFSVRYEFPLDQPVQNVIGIELTNYSFDKAMIPTFVGRYKTPYPNNVITFSGKLVDTVRNSARGSSTVDIEFADPTGEFTTILSFNWAALFLFSADFLSLTGFLFDSAELVVTLFYFFVAFGAILTPPVPGFTLADYDLRSTSVNQNGGENRINMWIRVSATPLLKGRVRFLFASGPTQSDSAHAQMGFDKVDTTPNAVTNGVVGTYLANVAPFRYLDVNVREFPEFKPLARIYAKSGTMRLPLNNNPGTVRLLQRPLQRLDSLNIDITIPGGRSPSFYSSRDHELEFEILSLEPSIDVPSWVKQKFAY